MRVKWSDAAQASARGFMRDQAGMRAMAEAVESLPGQPYPPPPLGVHHGDYHRLHVGEYRVLYKVAADVITIERVDRVIGLASPNVGARRYPAVMDGELELGLPESPWQWFDVRFTAGAEGIVPSAPGHPAVMVAYSAELAEAVVRVRARSEEGARLRAEGLCSGLDWVAGAKPEITPV